MTTVSAIVSSIRLADERKRADAAAYTALVADLANGGDVSPEDVLPVLDRAGRTCEELSEDVQTAADAAAHAAVAARYVERREAVVAATAEWEAAGTAYRADLEAAAAKLQEPLNRASQKVTAARAALEESSVSQQQLNALDARRRVLDRQRAKADQARAGTGG